MANRSKRIADRLRERINHESAAIAGYFREEAAVEPPKPTKKQRAATFLQMTQDEKQQQFLATEPGEWGNFIDEEMRNAVEQFGPSVAQAYPFYAYGLPPTAPEDNTSEATLARLEESLGVSLGIS